MRPAHRRRSDARPAIRGGRARSAKSVCLTHRFTDGRGHSGFSLDEMGGFAVDVAGLGMYAYSRMAQRAFEWRTWGGKRKGAGRPPKGGRAGVPHVEREVLAKRFPVHATWRMEREVWNLRTRRCFRVLERAMYAGATRFGFRLVHYSVMGNHVHLIVEAPDRRALGRAMKGLGVRIARALNLVMKRRGSVIGDRYHAHILKTPSEVKRARGYLLTNARHHYGRASRDPYTSRAPLSAPRTWLLRQTLL